LPTNSFCSGAIGIDCDLSPLSLERPIPIQPCIRSSEGYSNLASTSQTGNSDIFVVPFPIGVGPIDDIARFDACVPGSVENVVREETSPFFQMIWVI